MSKKINQPKPSQSKSQPPSIDLLKGKALVPDPVVADFILQQKYLVDFLAKGLNDALTLIQNVGDEYNRRVVVLIKQYEELHKRIHDNHNTIN